MPKKMIEGILCQGWNITLKNKNFEDFYKFLDKILTEKNMQFNIEKKKFGRTKMKEVIVINIDNMEYVLPSLELLTKGIKDIENICHDDYRYIFYLNGKYLPRGISNGDVDLLYSSYIENSNFDDYYKFLDKLYTEDIFSIVLERSIIKDINFQGYYSLIDESIKLYLKNNFLGAISIILPCIEGILRKIINNYLNSNNHYRGKDYLQKSQIEVLKKWGDIIYPKDKVWFHPMLEKDSKYLYLFDELPIIIRGFFKYLDAFFYRNIDEFRAEYPNENLNRHSILHGYTLDYGKKENYLMLFGMLDFLLLLSKFELIRYSHNYESYIKMKEYEYIKNTNYLMRGELNYKKILIGYLDLIKALFIESLNELENSILKDPWKKKYLKELLTDEISKKINKLIFIPFFIYTLIFDDEKETIILKYGSPGTISSRDILEPNIFEIYFTEEFERKNSYIYFYINLENKEIKHFIDNNIL
ncbi:MAG: hypothetical protein RR682_01760 [Cetobacterium sp.]|uniref:hypothetical protein n=1 Tax=Cetobacterium sp. TaxID=2071632 RepID=UPI002FCC0042